MRKGAPILALADYPGQAWTLCGQLPEEPFLFSITWKFGGLLNQYPEGRTYPEGCSGFPKMIAGCRTCDFFI